MRELKLKQIGGVLVADQTPEEIGLGCDKCDDHELVPVNQHDHPITGIMSRFREKHRGHGILHTLERRSGELYITGEIPGLS